MSWHIALVTPIVLDGKMARVAILWKLPFFLVSFHLKKIVTIDLNVLSISAVQQSDPGILYTLSFFYFTIHHILLQVIRYSSLCYTAGSHCLSISNAIVCIY